MLCTDTNGDRYGLVWTGRSIQRCNSEAIKADGLREGFPDHWRPLSAVLEEVEGPAQLLIAALVEEVENLRDAAQGKGLKERF